MSVRVCRLPIILSWRWIPLGHAAAVHPRKEAYPLILLFLTLSCVSGSCAIEVSRIDCTDIHMQKVNAGNFGQIEGDLEL